MFHYDFTWDLTENGLVFDKELNIKKLGWETGDYFRLAENSETGAMELVKLDPLQKFIIKGIENDRS